MADEYVVVRVLTGGHRLGVEAFETLEHAVVGGHVGHRHDREVDVLRNGRQHERLTGKAARERVEKRRKEEGLPPLDPPPRAERPERP